MKRDKRGRFIRGTNGDTFEGYGKWYDKMGYPYIFIDNKNIAIHVYVWERANGERPPGYHIHHIDGDKSNYKLENLICVSPTEHQRIHANWIKDENGNWSKKPCKNCKELLDLNLFYQRAGLTPSNICIKCSSDINKNRLKNDVEFREKKRLYLREYYNKNKKQILEKQKNDRKKLK